MGRTLYLECVNGISGDMTVGALLDLGADEARLRAALGSLPVSGYDIRISRVKISALEAVDFAVLTDAAHETRDHDMEFLYGHLHGGVTERHEHEDDHEDGHGHEHDHGARHGHEHDHGHSCGEGHTHAHGDARNLPEILGIIENSGISARAKHLAAKIFNVLGNAEAGVHGISPEEVHFHEVGAVDSIVDIVSAAVCLDDLDIDRVIVTSLTEGSGTVRCAHGILPVPVPAVASIAREYGLPLCITGASGEYVTPTGAAIAAAVRTECRLPQSFTIEAIGLGAGKRRQERPALLRAMIIKDESADLGLFHDTVIKSETNIDDTSGETLGFLMEELFKHGARDVYYTPIFMKKNRPAWQLSVIADEAVIDELEDIIFRETTTIGIRRMRIERHVAGREVIKVRTSLGEASVKRAVLPGDRGEIRYYPEYESVAQISRSLKLPFREVYKIIAGECEKAGVESDNSPIFY